MSTAEKATTYKDPEPEVVQLYEQLERNRKRLLKADTSRDAAAEERAEIWRALLAAGEDQAPIARASGVHKSYVKKDLERRAARTKNGTKDAAS